MRCRSSVEPHALTDLLGSRGFSSLRRAPPLARRDTKLSIDAQRQRGKLLKPLALPSETSEEQAAASSSSSSSGPSRVLHTNGAAAAPSRNGAAAAVAEGHERTGGGTGLRHRGADNGALPSEAERALSRPEAKDDASGSSRLQVLLSLSLAFVICNMDKVNMSVAIIPMSQQLAWSGTMSGVVQSSFFWGYALSQLPGGWLAQRFTGKKVLRAGVLIWSLATAAVPAAAGYMPALLFTRFLVGLGEGVSPPAATDVIARTVPRSERSRAVAIVFGGLNAGSVLGLLLAPELIEAYGWQSVFILFGLAGVGWCFAFQSTLDSTLELPTTSGGEDASHAANNGGAAVHHLAPVALEPKAKPIPWRRFVRSPAVLATVYAHFCNNWGHYVGLSWMPSYFSDELHLDLTHAALVSLLLPLSSVLVSSIAAPLADSLIARGEDVTKVRKVSQSVAFLGPAVCMSVACLGPSLLPHWMVAGTLALGFGLSSFAFAGLYSTHADISPKYASILLGMSSTVGALPGCFGIPLTGYLLDTTHSWPVAFFAPSIFFYLTGTLVWNLLADSTQIDFDA